MITVSTLNPKERGYHHGDLRATLVEAGLRALESQDVAELSLRQLAREAGVSATAVYRHFPDKQALLRALALEGIERLGRAQQAAAESASGGGDAFSATGRAYVRFALANPALFRLTFTQCRDLGQSLFGDTLAARLLRDKASRAAGSSEAQVQRLMIQAWAIVHGLAMLMLDGQLPADEALIDQIIDSQTLFAGHMRGSSSEASP